MNYNLQTEAKMLAAQSRSLRKQEVKLRNKRRKHKSLTNQDYLNDAREHAYHLRQLTRMEARYLHLLRAYLSGHDYNTVESNVRPNNKIHVGYLHYSLESYGYGDVISFDDLKKWVYEC